MCQCNLFVVAQIEQNCSDCSEVAVVQLNRLWCEQLADWNGLLVSHEHFQSHFASCWSLQHYSFRLTTKPEGDLVREPEIIIEINIMKELPCSVMIPQSFYIWLEYSWYSRFLPVPYLAEPSKIYFRLVSYPNPLLPKSGEVRKFNEIYSPLSPRWILAKKKEGVPANLNYIPLRFRTLNPLISLHFRCVVLVNPRRRVHMKDSSREQWR